MDYGDHIADRAHAGARACEQGDEDVDEDKDEVDDENDVVGTRTTRIAIDDTLL